MRLRPVRTWPSARFATTSARVSAVYPNTKLVVTTTTTTIITIMVMTTVTIMITGIITTLCTPTQITRWVQRVFAST